MTDYEKKSNQVHAQSQPIPGYQTRMDPQPVTIRDNYHGSQKLQNKVAIITGGDSGIGRSVAVHFAREGADVAFVYLKEDEDARTTCKLVEKEGRQCFAKKGDIRDREFCNQFVQEAVDKFGKINILVNHAGEQHPVEKVEDLDLDIMEKTYQTNIFAMYYMLKAAISHLTEGDSIINTTSVTAYVGPPHFLDYAATNGAIVTFTRSLAHNLAGRKIRVNAVAPGPIWTPLIPSTFDKDKVDKFGENTPMKRPGQPCEVAPAFVYLASEDASYVTGQVIHVDGGMSMQS